VKKEAVRTDLSPWRVRGSYVEACNCEAVCPCRRHGDRPGGLSTYGVCDFALSWHVADGSAADLDLSGLDVVLAGSYVDDRSVAPDATLGEWGVALYVDLAASDAQAGALEEIFLGRAGGRTLVNFAAAIGTVHAVRRARVRLEHRSGREHIAVENFVTVRGFRPVPTDEPVSCGIPGHDHPGNELVVGVMRVDDVPLVWEVAGRCGFATDFDYCSDDWEGLTSAVQRTAGCSRRSATHR
jgi:hypothetical protein